MSLGALERSEEEIAVYDDLVQRFSDRQEPAIAEKVASALGGKGWGEYEAGRFEDSVASSRAALVRKPGAYWIHCNLALALLHLGHVDEARKVYAEVAGQIDAVADLDRMALVDLDEALAKRPDLAGAAGIRKSLLERREELVGQ